MKILRISSFLTVLAAVSVVLFAAAAVSAAGLPDASGVIVKTQNDQLKKFPVNGFASGSSEIPAQEWDKWAKLAAPVIKEIINKLPDGYSFQVTGHTDSDGSAEASGSFIGNNALSEQRAKAVADSLRNIGITSSRMVTKGVADTETAQRCVTFKVVKTD